MEDRTVRTVVTFLQNSPTPSWVADCIPVMVNACTGEKGKAFIEKAETAELYVVPVSFGGEGKSRKTYQVGGKEFLVQGPSSNREYILAILLDKYPDLIVVDFTMPSAVNGMNFEEYYLTEIAQNFILTFSVHDTLFPITKKGYNLFPNVDNAELYCKAGVPFVMGTNGGKRDLLFDTVYNSDVYAVIAPQMGKFVFHN